MKLQHYILACDERGTTRWPSRSKTWALGGLVFEERERQELVSIWNRIKIELCENDKTELKWSHFFPGRHQERMKNPLIETDPTKWRKQAIWALNELFKNTKSLPISTYIRKNEAADDAFRTTSDNRKVLDIDVIWVGVLGQFALFLNEKTATGEIWFDNLGSQKEQNRKQKEWLELRNVEWPVQPETQLLLKSIAPKFKYFDSKTEPVIQIADFVSGIIWAASEGDEIFLLKNLNRYVLNGKRTYRLLKIE
jgi:hypothetical protein